LIAYTLLLRVLADALKLKLTRMLAGARKLCHCC